MLCVSSPSLLIIFINEPLECSHVKYPTEWSEQFCLCSVAWNGSCLEGDVAVLRYTWIRVWSI